MERSTAFVLKLLMPTFALTIVSGARTVVGQVADTVVIRVSAPVHPGVATLVQEVELGKLSSDPQDVFTYARVHPGREGSVWVVDIRDLFGRETAVRQYDRSGRFMRALGRNGQGPGEYHFAPGDVKELADGRILLSDARGLVVYSATGQGVGRWFAKAQVANSGSPILIDPAGFVCTYGATRASIDVAAVPHLYRFRLDGTLVDVTSPPEASFPRPEIMDRETVPFVPSYKSAWSPLGYFVTSYTATYAIDLRMPTRGGCGVVAGGSNRVTSIRRSVTAIPVQTAERSDWTQSMTMYFRSNIQTPNWQWNAPPIPNVKPPIRDLFVDADGRIWVRLSQAAVRNDTVRIATQPVVPVEKRRIDARYRWAEPLVYDVLEPSGRYLGQVRLPDGTVSTAISGNTAWIVVNDADDVPIVRRYRIVW